MENWKTLHLHMIKPLLAQEQSARKCLPAGKVISTVSALVSWTFLLFFLFWCWFKLYANRDYAWQPFPAMLYYQ